MADQETFWDMKAEPVIPAWEITAKSGTNGNELQRTIIKGFCEKMPFDEPVTLTFTFEKHGEFFRGALTMASLRYTRDFYELLKRYETIRVTITKRIEEKK